MPRSRESESAALRSRTAVPFRAPIAALLLVALLAQLCTPAFVRPAAAQAADTLATAAEPAAEPDAATAARAREDRHWADLVRACAANAKHVRLHLPGRTVETDQVAPEPAGLRIRAPHLGTARGTITEVMIGVDTLVAWNDISSVEVRNVNSRGESAGTGALVGLGFGTILALGAAAAVAGAVATSPWGFLAYRNSDSHVAAIVLGAAALGMAAGAAAPHRPHGGWVTCCERDTSEVHSGDVTLH